MNSLIKDIPFFFSPIVSNVWNSSITCFISDVISLTVLYAFFSSFVTCAIFWLYCSLLWRALDSSGRRYTSSTRKLLGIYGCVTSGITHIGWYTESCLQKRLIVSLTVAWVFFFFLFFFPLRCWPLDLCTWHVFDLDYMLYSVEQKHLMVFRMKINKHGCVLMILNERFILSRKLLALTTCMSS